MGRVFDARCIDGIRGDFGVRMKRYTGFIIYSIVIRGVRVN